MTRCTGKKRAKLLEAVSRRGKQLLLADVGLIKKLVY